MRLFPALLRRAAAVLAMVAIAGQAASAAPRALPVGRCLNLGNHLDTGDAQDKRLAAEDFHNIRAAGFTTVRLPVNWAKYSDPVGRGHGISPLWMARVSAMVDAALDAGLNVILDSHHFDALHGDPAAASPWLAALWYQIGWQLEDRPTTRLWFEIDNEPSDRLTNANLMATLGPALAAIRQSNPDRPVLIGGENWSNVESLASLPLPADAHVYPTFHYYTPMGFTHQG
ncbi:MAG TPA: cellulase family glycosylhydrolase, partial [Novosphingobium sp.]|nr:cellulase family glycosylhydrolase [Novosphingobium sp.]